jgi:hypothetical protein
MKQRDNLREYRAFNYVEQMVNDIDRLLTYKDVLDDDAVKKLEELKNELYSFLRMHG